MKMPGTQQETCRFKTQTYQQTTMTHTIGLHSVQSQGPVSFHHRNVFHALMHDTVSSPTFFFSSFWWCIQFAISKYTRWLRHGKNKSVSPKRSGFGRLPNRSPPCFAPLGKNRLPSQAQTCGQPHRSCQLGCHMRAQKQDANSQDNMHEKRLLTKQM